ncbi:MAG: response regulator [Candidatus Binatia bacterium]
MRALIVDDDETSCRLLAKVLQSCEIEVDWRIDSCDGYGQALSGDYDLLVLDVRMPKLSGTEFAARIKQALPEVKIILISAFADEHLRNTAAALEVALLSKPFTPQHLLALATSLLWQPTEPRCH